MAQLDVKLNPSKSTITADLKSNGIVSYIAGPGIIIDGRIIKADFTTISTATNLQNGSGTGSAQMKSDGGITQFDFTNKNPNATALDPTLTGNINYGATGNYATTLGGKNAAQGKRSLAEGSTTIAKGDYSHAEGTNSVALGISSHAEGQTTTTYGAGSHAEGNNTLALGPFSHAEGRNTITYNEEAHAGGLDSIAARPYTFAHGNYVVAENIAEAVFGQFNDFAGAGSYDNNRLFVVGNGDSHTSRSNAFEVYKDGHAAVGRDITSSDVDLTVATKKYVDDHTTSYTGGYGITISDNEISVDTSVVAEQSDISEERQSRQQRDNELSQAIQDEEATRAEYDTALNNRIDSLESRGRFLSTWNATTGKPSTYPTVPAGATYPYTYEFKAGDYYIIHNVGTENKKPKGSSITKQSAEAAWEVQSEAETETVSDNGTYTYDGTNWVLMGAGAAAAWGSIGGNIADQTDLSNALNAKQDALTAGSGITISDNEIAIDTSVVAEQSDIQEERQSRQQRDNELALAIQDKQDILTAGANISITDDNIISATNVVTTNTAQTISGAKTFSDKIHLASSKTLEFDHTTYPANIENYNGTMRINPYTNNTYYMYCFGQDGMYPFWDNVRSSGLSNHRWTTVYTTNLSDATNSVAVAQIENNTNKVTSISASSTDTQYPSAKCVYDIVGNINTILDQINGEVI